MKKFSLPILTLSSIFYLGCGNNDPIAEDINTTQDDNLAVLITTHGLSGNPAKGMDIPSIETPKAQLGMKLFYTKALGGDKDAACATCHHPMLGGGDNLSLPIGVAALDPELLGQGRLYDPNAVRYDHGYALVPRNAPSTYNVALWKRSVFWDGRVQNVSDSTTLGIRTPDTPLDIIDPKAGANLAVAQARFPVTAENEMRGFVFDVNKSRDDAREHLAKRLNDSNASDYIQNSWQEEFTPVYGADSITFPNIVDAIGEYERSQLFIDSPWSKYVKGDHNAISTSAKRGAKLFYNSYSDGGMNCVSCHSGDFFTDEDFHVMAIPQVGHGKNDKHEDFGLFDEIGTHKYAFRTPTLLNVEMTGPWGHDGAYTDLEDVVRHMVNPETAIENYDLLKLNSNVLTENSTINTQKALDQLIANRSFSISTHQSVDATDKQINDLVEFLKALTDPCLKDRECVGKWIPENVSGPDGLQLNALDKDGNLL